MPLPINFPTLFTPNTTVEAMRRKCLAFPVVLCGSIALWVSILFFKRQKSPLHGQKDATSTVALCCGPHPHNGAAGMTFFMLFSQKLVLFANLYLFLIIVKYWPSMRGRICDFCVRCSLPQRLLLLSAADALSSPPTNTAFLQVCLC